MATMITSECINCGACEPECPNTAIYQGGVAWDFNDATHPAISQDIFYIVPEKCTECVGFHDHEACAAVCPVDCCIPDPAYPESDELLIARAREIHPDTEFPPDYPSRFKGEGGGASAPAATNGAALPAAAPAAAAVAVAPAAAPLGSRVERPLSAPKPAPPKPVVLKDFAQELPGTFEDALSRLSGSRRGSSFLVKTLAFLGSPILGALPAGQKQTIEDAVGDRRAFSVAGATGFNILHNMILYPVLCSAFAVVFLGKQAFTTQLSNWIVLGVALATLETFIRVREGFRAMPMDEIKFRAAAYGPPLAVAAMPLITAIRRTETQGSIGVDGFHGGTFEEKTERERRYGEVYQLRQDGNGFLLRLEFPRVVPKSGMKEELGIANEMPDYDYDLAIEGRTFVVKGSVRDPEVRKLAAISPAFPPDFTTKIDLPAPVVGFNHRIENKVLEVVLLKS